MPNLILKYLLSNSINRIIKSFKCSITNHKTTNTISNWENNDNMSLNWFRSTSKSNYIMKSQLIIHKSWRFFENFFRKQIGYRSVLLQNYIIKI